MAARTNNGKRLTKEDMRAGWEAIKVLQMIRADTSRGAAKVREYLEKYDETQLFIYAERFADNVIGER